MKQEEIEKQSEEYVKNIISIAPKMYDAHKKIIMKESFQDGAKWGISNAIEWHDLRKNPDDLPKEDCETVTLHVNGNKNIIKWKCGEWTNAIVIPVIAWCELPTYKE